MDKCKCIKQFNDKMVSFSENYFYDYDYIPTVADYPATYRVYNDLKSFRRFSLIEFKQYFKRY
jgi:hypothetical protein